MNVSYASALLVPCWQRMTLCLYAGPVALDNVVLCSSVDVLKGWLDSFSFLVDSMLGCTCQAVRCFSHICSLFRAHLCWGGG